MKEVIIRIIKELVKSRDGLEESKLKKRINHIEFNHAIQRLFKEAIIFEDWTSKPHKIRLLWDFEELDKFMEKLE